MRHSDHNISFQRIFSVALICLFALLSRPGEIYAQGNALPYYLDGNDVVFVFDVRNYAKALQSENADNVDFKDLGIYEVAISGQFNNWSKKGWKMQKHSEFIFELRKPLMGFNDAFPLEFRYVINGKYLSDPADVKTDPRKVSDDFLKDVYKLDLSVINVHSSGKVLFSLKGHSQAQEVILAGSFNGWDEYAIKMHKVSDGWELRADLPPGRYEYKFIADREWLHDPLNKESVTNEHGTLNSVLWVTLPVTFTLSGFPGAKTVILAGSFNEWNERKERMTLANGVWTTTLNLPGGKHTYKFIVDGTWIIDPANQVLEDDGTGNKNSVRFVH